MAIPIEGQTPQATPAQLARMLEWWHARQNTPESAVFGQKMTQQPANFASMPQQQSYQSPFLQQGIQNLAKWGSQQPYINSAGDFISGGQVTPG